jgi:general secretion pathway protein D
MITLKKCTSAFLLLTFYLQGALSGHQTIAEKKLSFSKNESGLEKTTNDQLKIVNEELDQKRFELARLYEEGEKYYLSGANQDNYHELIAKISEVKKEIAEIETMWRKEMAGNESYALWHQPEATLSQLIMDYGASDYVYLIPQELGAIRININSNLPIPRLSWEGCLEMILTQNGIGVRQLNSYVRGLYLLKGDFSPIKCITNQLQDLSLMDSEKRVCFVLNVESTDPRMTFNFLKKFSNPNTTSMEIIRGDIFIISTVESILELMKLHSFAKSKEQGEDYHLVSLTKVNAKEMQTILESAFASNQNAVDTLRVLPMNSMSHSLFLFGTKDEINKALKLIRDVESQVEDFHAKTLFWYTVKHSDAEELATVLAKVYDLLMNSGATHDSPSGVKQISEQVVKAVEKEKGEHKDSLAVAPARIGGVPERKSHRTSDGQNNFIVDAKTGSIIMVVEQEALPKIKELLKKLDVPKKMVQIEVLLFEKKLSNQNKSGLNLLRLGSSASGQSSKDTACMTWNKAASGILEFLISHSKGSGIPAFDLAYNFLLGQEDVQINASPSVTTVNQTPATIAIVEEISLNTGTENEKDKSRSSYARAQYGITIQITPTINMGEGESGEDAETGFITLDTDITFDTTKNNSNERPDVTRRHIKNHVRIADGQTVILGGLRRKNTQDSKESIPFLGEIPGIGKLFSTVEMYDNSTEMFVFITPKIISDPIEDAEAIKREELKKRPGDVPEVIHHLIEAKNRERKKLFEGGLTALFGRYGSQTTPYKERSGEYDGR